MSAPALMVRAGRRYRAATVEEVQAAFAAQSMRSLVGRVLSAPSDAREYVRGAFAGAESERFAAVWLSNRHRVIAFDVLFTGTVDGCSVYPREVVKACLKHNAATCIFAHNHPSGVLEPSTADELIARRLKEALALINVRVLDHYHSTKGACCCEIRID